MKIERSKYKDFTIYNVIYDLSTDFNLLCKIEQFAEQSYKNTYRRSGMDDVNHKKNIIIGKRAEEAASFLIATLYREKTGKNIELKPNYDSKNIDVCDIEFRNKKIDVKSSSIVTKRKSLSLEEALEKFNFTVLLDQSPKDIIIQALYPSRYSYDNFWFSVWQYVNTVINEGTLKYIQMNGNSGEYKLLPLMKGIKLEELITRENI